MATIIFDLVQEALENEIYDLMDEVSTEQLEQAVSSMVHGLQRAENTLVHIGSYSVKANNTEYGSWVSISNADGTGVSRSLTYILPPNVSTDSQLELDHVTNIIGMLNEAWYLLNN